MYVHIYVSAYLYTVYTHTYMCVYTHTQVCVCIHINSYAHMYKYIAARYNH